MTKEEYNTRVAELTAKMKEMRQEVDSIRAIYLAGSPFKVGDKVRATHYPGKSVLCYIARVYEVGGEYRYEFNKMKKDGSMSMQSAGILANNAEKVD